MGHTFVFFFRQPSQAAAMGLLRPGRARLTVVESSFEPVGGPGGLAVAGRSRGRGRLSFFDILHAGYKWC
jgi:hypothetical protein